MSKHNSWGVVFNMSYYPSFETPPPAPGRVEPEKGRQSPLTAIIMNPLDRTAGNPAHWLMKAMSIPSSVLFHPTIIHLASYLDI